MRIKSTIARVILLLCSTFAATAILAQTTNTWTGAANGNWDTTTPGNWTLPPTIWQNGQSALFDDTATGTTSVTVNSPVIPLSTTVSNDGLSYSIASSGANNIGGTGGLLKSGTNILTLSGQNTYTGSNILSGGELIAGSAENPGASGPLGSNNVITFAGGTLGYSVSNSFDYSSRFDTSPNQGYNIDTAGQNVTFATGLGSSGGTLGKFGAGTLTLSGTSSYTGATTVSAGKLVFQGSKSGSGDISVADGATLGVFDTGTPITPGTLTLGTSSGATLEFNNINFRWTGQIVADNLSSAGNITININGGVLQSGGSYPLLNWTNAAAPALTLGTLNNHTGYLDSCFSCPEKQILLEITESTYTWTGATDGTNFGAAGNWNPVGVPDGDWPDVAQFDGVTTSNLFINVNNPGQIDGENVVLTAHQTNSIDFYSAVAGSSPFVMGSISIAAGAGAFSLGDTTTNVVALQGTVYNFVNNSTNAATIYPNAGWFYGGPYTATFAFAGSGNWDVTNYLTTAYLSTFITKSGSGTIFWTGANVPNSPASGSISSIVINGGTIVLKTANLLGSSIIGQSPIVDNTLLEYDEATAGSGALSGSVSGSGSVQVNSGALALLGTNTYTGSNILTGGELIADSAEIPGSYGPLGVAGTISFMGGTLGFSVSNAFDYSSRFDTSPNQMYNFDTAGQIVTFATGLGSSGGTLAKTGAGTLTLSGASSYTGATTVSAGKLVFQGSKSGSGNIGVADGATLGVFATGTQITPSTFNVGNITGATLEFNNLGSTSAPVIAAGTFSAGGTITIIINSGTFTTIGQSFPLLSWASGSPPAVTLRMGMVTDAGGTLSTNGNTIQFNLTSLPIIWTGATNGNWDTTTPGNWTPGGIPPTTIWTNGEPALFDDTATGTTIVTVNSPVTPLSTTVNNSSLSYNIASSGANNIGGTAGLLKSGTNTLTLSGGANTYTGATTINGGILSVGHLANASTPSDIGAANGSAANLVLNGGTLQYTGGTQSVNRLFTLGAFGGTIDNEGSGTLTLNNAGTIAMTGSGARVLTLTGVNPNGDTLAGALPDGSGGTSLVKQGTGTWIVSGNNTYSGTTTISSGTLQVGEGGGGSLGSSNVFDDSALVFDRTGTLTVPGAISGTGSVTNNGTGTVVLVNDNSYTGGTTINSGTLQLGNGGPTGSLYNLGLIVDNGTLIFNSTGTQSYFDYNNDTITGTGNVIVRAGKVLAVSYNPYTGWTEIDAGAVFEPCFYESGVLLSSVVTNNGTLLFARLDRGIAGYAGNIFGTGKIMSDNSTDNTGDSTFTGTNFSTGGLVIAGGYIILGDNVNPFFGSMSPIGDIVFTNSIMDFNDRGLILNRPDNYTFSNNIIGKTAATLGETGNPGELILMGSGIVTLIGATNTCQAGTVISNGVLVVGNGGGTGSLGNGDVNNQTKLVFNRSGTLNVPGNFSGPGTVAMVGRGVVSLTGSHAALAGSMAVSNGILGVANSAGGDLDVAGGTLAVGGFQTVGTLAIGDSAVSPAVAADLNISSGTLSMALNTALAQSNSFVQMTVTNVLTTLTYNTNGSITTNTTITSATGAIYYTGGTLQLINVGPTLQVGQRFVLFSQPIPGGMPVVPEGNFTVNNNLAVDGSVTVATVAQPPSPKINKLSFQNGTNLVITATNNFGPGGSWDLVGTNFIDSSVANWPVITSGNFDANGNVSLTLTNGATNAAQFFDLRAP